MKRFIITILALLVCSSTLFGQKKRLDHSAYDLWKYVRAEQLSDNGNIATWELKPTEGDGELFIRNFAKNTEEKIERGTGAKLFDGQKWVLYKIAPEYAVTRKAKIDKTDKADKADKADKGEMSKTEIVVQELSSGKTFRIKDTHASYVATEAPVLAYKHKIKDENQDSTKKKKVVDMLIVMDVARGDTILKVEKADKFALNRNGDMVYSIKEDSSASVWVWKRVGGAVRIAEHGKGGKVGQIVLDKENGKRFAYTIMPDSAKSVQYQLFDVDFVSLTQKEIEFEQGNVTFCNLDPVSYSKKGGLLRFSVASRPEPKTKDTIPSDEKFVLDVWNYKDTLIQSQQLVQADNIRKNASVAMYDISSGYSRRLTHSYFESIIVPRERDDSPCYLLLDNSRYVWSTTWSASPRPKDIYLYYPAQDRREAIVKEQRGPCELSPESAWVVYYSMADSMWFCYDRELADTRCLTKHIDASFYDENHDRPGIPTTYGTGGWVSVKGKGRSKAKEYILLYDKYDIWLSDPSGAEAPLRLTMGRETNITYRVIDTATDNEYCNGGKSILLSMFDNVTKHGGFATLSIEKSGALKGTAQTLVLGDHRYTYKAKAKDADRMMWRRENFNEFADLHTGGMKLENSTKLTDANPHMHNYMWGSVELIDWKDPNGKRVEGQVFYPEDYDRSRKYPVMVYFYERNSDNLFKHHTPYPSRSIICPTMFTSNDYVVFIPDINFRVGYPGPSAYDAVVSGSQEIIRRGIADPERIGLQGQSWGGYQINYIVTQTDMFRCASAGAGVSDMISGYATTRDDSGTARMVQYESGQSRIGATLWDRTDLYMLNSPVLFLPKVNTPLLLRHSNNDNAVPFQQSMEMFNGLRRLGKQVWLLNYNGEFHNLTTRAACKDWSVRMSQFFDYYLKDAPMPRWMLEGITLRERGKELKLDLVE